MSYKKDKKKQHPKVKYDLLILVLGGKKKTLPCVMGIDVKQITVFRSKKGLGRIANEVLKIMMNGNGDYLRALVIVPFELLDKATQEFGKAFGDNGKYQFIVIPETEKRVGTKKRNHGGF